MNRRAFLQSVAVAATLPRAFAQSAPTATKLTDSLTLITGAGNNILSLAGDGALLVDCGDAAHSAEVLRLTGKVATVINTHWHPESTGANDALAQSGAKLVSSVATQLWMTQDIYHDWEKKTYPKRAKTAQPTQTFYETLKLTANGETIEMGLLPMAHTDGDIYVFFRDANVIAVGDAISPVRDPVLDWFGGGWLGGREDAQEKLLKLVDDKTRIVPSYGPVVGRAELQAEYDVTRKLFDRMIELVRKGMSAKEMLDEGLMKDLPRTFRDPYKFAYNAHKGFWAHHNSLGPDVL